MSRAIPLLPLYALGGLLLGDLYLYLTVSTTYLLIIRRRCIYNWYILCVLCGLAASRSDPAICKLTIQYTHNIPIFVYTAPPDDEQIVLKKCTGC
jgi:prepilin signal peptidase PulO-like enzyme (type II secretory pathway)